MTRRSSLGSKKTQKQIAQKTEEKIARELGGSRTPNSGAVDGYKGDVELPEFLLDSKETGAKSIMVSGRDLTKISREAREANKSPGLVLKLSGVPVGVSRQWVCVPLSTFKKLTE